MIATISSRSYKDRGVWTHDLLEVTVTDLLVHPGPPGLSAIGACHAPRLVGFSSVVDRLRGFDHAQVERELHVERGV